LSACIKDKTNAMRVILVEHDQYRRDTLVDELSKQGFVVQSFAHGASLLGSLGTAIDADIIILDWSLPKTSDIDLLPQLRRLGINVPVVFLAAHNRIAHESLAFEGGAMDFIDKSRGVELLVNRLKVVVQAIKPEADLQPNKCTICGKLVLRPDLSRAYWNEIDVGLTAAEYKIVHLLALDFGRHVSYGAIYDHLHNEGDTARSEVLNRRMSVRSAVKRIRTKFRNCDPTFAEIESYAAFGYRWGAPEPPAEQGRSM
jgi:two-component system response regulator ChvI